jgi:UPF0042 nucleotide-binding protein
MSDYLLMTGMSGAGRSTAAAALEDVGWYVIDNMPPSLLEATAGLVGRPGSGQERVALVIGRGGGAHVEEALPAMEDLAAQGHRVRLVFLDAPDEVLVRRYEGTRRRHPMGGSNVPDAIAAERDLLEPVRTRADVVLDTGQLNVHQLTGRIAALFGERTDRAMQTSVVSFGYKHGVPLDADVVLDCRFLPNPHWVEALQPFSGLDAPVRDYVLAQEPTGPFLDQVDSLLAMVLPAFVAEGKPYLTVAMGCTGGRHRSVVLAEELALRLRDHGTAATVFHRDIDR